ncbi:DgyrCDS12029 [Dimorphilus gyrociliatus]|uniref:DgyrCDS12029 n=1 Tax=Dimorphilus gyrociliatus TaxID=2664684 RepID=A0A7I8W7L0_9ANNE|nr:DgyrCDS12029 [Dimorphilus gyrociliatus]
MYSTCKRRRSSNEMYEECRKEMKHDILKSNWLEYKRYIKDAKKADFIRPEALVNILIPFKDIRTTCSILKEKIIHFSACQKQFQPVNDTTLEVIDSIVKEVLDIMEELIKIIEINDLESSDLYSTACYDFRTNVKDFINELLIVKKNPNPILSTRAKADIDSTEIWLLGSKFFSRVNYEAFIIEQERLIQGNWENGIYYQLECKQNHPGAVSATFNIKFERDRRGQTNQQRDRSRENNLPVAGKVYYVLYRANFSEKDLIFWGLNNCIALSSPLVIITQTSQEVEAKAALFWCKYFSEAKMDLKLRIIKPLMKVEWSVFANALKQEWNKHLKMSLADEHFSYLKELFELEDDVLTKGSFEKHFLSKNAKGVTVWRWWQCCMNLAIDELQNYWEKGKVFSVIIYGFVSKSKAAKILNDQETGTFLLRFSENTSEIAQSQKASPTAQLALAVKINTSCIVNCCGVIIHQLRLEDILKPDKKKNSLSLLLRNLYFENSPLVANGFILLHPNARQESTTVPFHTIFEDVPEGIHDDEQSGYTLQPAACQINLKQVTTKLKKVEIAEPLLPDFGHLFEDLN